MSKPANEKANYLPPVAALAFLVMAVSLVLKIIAMSNQGPAVKLIEAAPLLAVSAYCLYSAFRRSGNGMPATM